MRESETQRPTKLISLLWQIEPTSKEQKYQNSVALPFEQVLPEAVIQKVFQEQGVGYRQVLYTPIVVI